MPPSQATAEVRDMEEGSAVIQAVDGGIQLGRLGDLHRLLEEEGGAGKGRTVIIEFFKQTPDRERVLHTPPEQECILDEATLASLDSRYPSLRIISRVLLPQSEDVSSSLRFSLTPRWVVFNDGQYFVEKRTKSSTRLTAFLQAYADGAPLPSTAKALPLRSPRWYEHFASCEVEIFERWECYLRIDWKRFLVLYILTFVWLFRHQLFSR